MSYHSTCLKFANCFPLQLEQNLHTWPWVLKASSWTTLSSFLHPAVLLFLQHATFMPMVGLCSLPWTLFPSDHCMVVPSCRLDPIWNVTPSKRASLISQINKHPVTFAHCPILVIFLALITLLFISIISFVCLCSLFVCCLVYFLCSISPPTRV